MARACSVEGCSRPIRCKALCTMHYGRWMKTGDVGDASPVRGRNEGACSIDGCDSPMRKTGMCASHYAQKRATGEAKPFRYKWASAGAKCAVCGEVTPGTDGLRKYCSRGCVAIARNYPNGRPGSISCAQCGDPIDLNERRPGRRRSPSTRRMCTPCRRKHAGRHGAVVHELAVRDGTDCSICGEAVDMGLSRPESLFGPSVDHVIPRSRGGADDLSNYALAHYWCNAVKSDRLNFTI